MSNVTFQTADGKSIHAEFEGPDEGPAGGIVLLQEYWGLNDHIKGLTRRLARAGFFVVAPDLYHGEVAQDATSAKELMNALDTLTAVREIAAAANYLRSLHGCNKKIGAMGFCLGGALAFASACHIPNLSAIVPFYGIPPAEKVDYSHVTAPIQAHFSATDRWATKDKAEAIKEAVGKQGVSMDLIVYDAPHAFMNDTRPEVYDPAAATLAWSRAVDFLKKRLS